MANLAKNFRHKKIHSDWCQITSHGLRPLNLHCREKKKKKATRISYCVHKQQTNKCDKQTNVTPEISKYCSVGSHSTLTKWIIFYFIFQKMKINSFLNFLKLYFFSIIYYKYCDMGSEIIQNVAYNNYDNFQYVNFIFS
jgi:hypothetical protein